MCEEIKRLQQIVTEDVLSKREVYSRIKKQLAPEIVDPLIQQLKDFMSNPSNSIGLQTKINEMANNGLDTEKTVLHLITVIAMAPENTIPLQSLIGGFESAFDFQEEAWDTQMAYYVILALAGNLYSVEANTQNETVRIIRHFELSPEMKGFINKTMYLPPLICEPQEITSNRGTAYYSPLVRNDSVILGKGNHHEGKLPLDCLNILNNIKFSLDLEALKEVPKPKETLANKKDRIQWQRFIDGTKAVAEYLIGEGNEFHFNHKIDFRARMYSQGYHINYQSDEWHKAMISLHKKEVITCK